MSFNAARMVQEARYWADIGYHEGPANKNVFSLWQYGTSYNPWCDSFVSYCAWVAGYRFPSYDACGDKGDYNVGSAHQHAVRQGIWRPANTTARPGWLIVLSFDVPDQHIEMVLSDQGGSQIATIGGNTGDAVRYRIRSRSNVVGFIALDEDHQNPPPVVIPTEEQNVKITDRTDAVLLKNGGRYVLGADGGVFAYAPAPFHGSLPGIGVKVNPEVGYAVSLLPTASQDGYWILTSDGSVYSFGDAKYFGVFSTQLPHGIAVQLIGDGKGGYKAIRDDGVVLKPIVPKAA